MATTSFPVDALQWVDLGLTPCSVQIERIGIVLIALAPSAPATLSAAAHTLSSSDRSRDFSAPGMHVYARALTGSNAVVVSPIAAGGGGGSGGDAATETTLSAIKTALLSQVNLAETIWLDNSGAYFIRRDIVNEVSGAISLTYTDPTGAAATPGAGLRPFANERSRSTIQKFYEVTSAAAGYALTDLLAKLIVLDTTTSLPSVVLSTWLNLTQGTVIPAPAPANIQIQDEFLTANVPGVATAAKQDAILAALSGILAFVRPPLTYSAVAGSPFTLTPAWTKVATASSATKGLRIAPIVGTSTFDIEWVSVAPGAAAPTDTLGEPVLGGEDFAAGLPIGDLYLKSASGQRVLVKTGA